MKKIAAMLLAVAVMIALAACGDRGDPDPSGNAPSSQASAGNSQQSAEKSPSAPAGAPSQGGGWSDAKYTPYTGGVPEPAFDYTITGVIGNMGLSFKGDASEDEIGAWRQALLDGGFEENSVAGDTWTVFNDTHSIAHSGGGYFNIQAK